jgi:hypothetical protein
LIDWIKSLSSRIFLSEILACYVPDFEMSFFLIKGIGEAKPLASNVTDEGRALNRWVEFGVRSSEFACVVDQNLTDYVLLGTCTKSVGTLSKI